ncbi:MAG: alpha-E domain-containing protein [Cellulomonadaceae bacterium]|nr:alpha-E domain-containing protein [Cellulomonadaceae bacterium]
MLSRIAESLFWIGRYVERADDTARILDIHLQRLSEDPFAQEELACRALLAIMNNPVPFTADDDESAVTVDRELVMRTLARDRNNASSIVGALVAARENARRAREIVSTELWEALNVTRNEVGHQAAILLPHHFFAWVRMRAAVVAGIMTSAISRDATWHFMILGRAIERADMTARLVTTQARLGEAGPGWITLLRSCGAHEAYLRAHRGRTDDESAAGFLLRDRLFPRSIVAALTAADNALQALEPGATVRGEGDEARRALGIVRTELEYGSLDDLLDNLPDVMMRVQRACAQAADAVRERYFPAMSRISWTKEAM